MLQDSSAVSSESETDSGSRSKGSHPSATDLGKRVLFRSQNDKKEKYGTLRSVNTAKQQQTNKQYFIVYVFFSRYWGTPEFAPGSWCGIELDEPTGKNNGSVHGIRYFSCPVNYGVFIPVGRVELDSAGLSRAKPQTVTVERIKKSSLSSNKGVFTYHTLPRASSIPALNKISSSPRSATLSPSIRLEVPAKKHVADKKHSAPSIGLSTLSKHKKSNGPTVKKSQYLSTSTGLKKYTSESNIRGRLTESTNIPDHQTKRSSRKLLSSCSDTQSKFESNSLRSFNSCNDLSHQTKKSPIHTTVLFPRTSTPYDSEDSQSRYSSTSDLSRRNSTSDSDPTPQSSSASPDIELTLLESADNAFLLSSLNDTVIKIPSPEHKAPLPLGLSTPTTNFIETSRCNGGRGGECRMPSPEQTPVKRYHNRQRVRTLEHPLINGHSAHRLPSEYCDTTEEEEDQDNIFISSHGQSQEIVFAVSKVQLVIIHLIYFLALPLSCSI